MGNTTKTESSYEYNQDNFNFIITCNSNNSIMSESYQDNIQRTSDNNNSLQYDLEFTILYKLRCEGNVKESEKIKPTLIYTEDIESNNEIDIMDIKPYPDPDSQMRFVLEL